MTPRRPVAGLALLLAVAAGAADAARYPEQPARGNSLVCVSDSGIACIGTETGDLAWTALDGEHTLEATIAGDRVLVPGATGLHAFDADTGERLWHWRSGGLVFPAVVESGVVYASDELGRLRAIDLESGHGRWERRFDGWVYPPAFAGGVLVTGGRGAVVRGLDPAGGETKWRRGVPQELVYRPVPAGSTVVVTTFDGSVTAIRDDGDVAWQATDPVASLSPAVTPEIMVFGGLDGRLRAREPRNGRLTWSRRLGDGQVLHRARFEPGRDRMLVLAPDDRILILESGTGRLVRRAEAPLGMIGVPVYLDDGWYAVVRRAGTISLVKLSQEGTGEQ